MRTVLKLLVLFESEILPVATRFVVPRTVRFEPGDCVIAPLVRLTVRFPALN